MDAWRDSHMSIVTTFLKQEYAGSGRPSPTENHSPEEVCQSLESLCVEELQNVRVLHEKIAQRRAISNLLVPFACFPPEIFCEVVSYLLKPGKPPGLDFLNAISTCRMWRNAATSNLSFWTHICLNNPSLAKASVERTHKRGLHIVLQDAKCDIDAAVAVLTPHASRIQSIEVRHSSALVIAAFFGKMNVAAPSLHSLTINATRASFDQLVIPSLFAGETPSLRRLELDNVVLGSTTSLSTLVQLHLRNTSLPLPAMLALLDPCTNLQTLAIYGYHLWGDDDQVGADRVVNLPSLRELLLDTQPIAHSDLLLSHIALPESALLRIAVDNMVDEDFAVPDLAALSHRLPCATGIRQLELTWDDTTQTAYLRGSRIPDSEQQQQQQHLVPAVEIAVHGAEWLLDAVPQDELPIDASAVEVLVVNSGGAQGPGFTQWPDLLQHLPALKTLRLHEPNTPTAASLLHALAASRFVPLGPLPMTPPDAGTFRLAFCPALMGLEMRGFAWHADIEREFVGMLKERWHKAPGVLREVRVCAAPGVVDGTMAFPGNGGDAQVQLFFSSAA